jgi:hypothetical protein
MPLRRRPSSAHAVLALACLVMASLASTGIAFGRAAAPGDEALREADRAFFAAIASHPPAALEDLLDEGFAYRTSRGAVIGKRSLIDHLSQGLTRVSATRSLRALRVRAADTAVITGVAEVLVEESDGQRAVWSRYTHVWVARKGRWRLLYREASESPGRLPDAEAAPGLAP